MTIWLVVETPCGASREAAKLIGDNGKGIIKMCINVEKAIAKTHKALNRAQRRCNVTTARYLDAMKPLYVDFTPITPLVDCVNLGFEFWFATSLFERCNIFRKVNEFGMYRSITQGKFERLRTLENKLLDARDRAEDLANDLADYLRIQPSLFDDEVLAAFDDDDAA